jgi:flagellar motor switch protein FliM
VTLDLGEGAKTGQILLAVPVTGTVAETGPSPDAPANDPGWRARWQALVRAAPVALEGVLLRRTLPLARVEALNVGDVLSFDRAELATVDVADSAGQRRFTARLGQSAGRRALMLSDGMGLGPAPKADPPAPEPPPAVAPGAPPPA